MPNGQTQREQLIALERPVNAEPGVGPGRKHMHVDQAPHPHPSVLRGMTC